MALSLLKPGWALTLFAAARSFCCVQFLLHRALLLSADSFAGSHKFLMHTGLLLHVLLHYYTIAIQLRCYTSTTLVHDCHATATLLHYCHTITHFGCTTILLPHYSHTTTQVLRYRTIWQTYRTIATLHSHCQFTRSKNTLLHYRTEVTLLRTSTAILRYCRTTATLLPHYCASATLLPHCYTTATTLHYCPTLFAVQLPIYFASYLHPICTRSAPYLHPVCTWIEPELQHHRTSLH